MVLHGNVLSRASVVLYSSGTGFVSTPTPLWQASPDAVLEKQTLGGTLRVVAQDDDMFRVSVNLKSAIRGRGAGDQYRQQQQQRMWDTIIIRDDSGRGFGMLLESARILPDRPIPGIKDGTSSSCVGSICNEGLEQSESATQKTPKLVPLFGSVSDKLEAMRGPETPPTSASSTPSSLSSDRVKVKVNGRLPDEGFTRGELDALCDAVAATGLGLCMLDDIDRGFIERDPSANVHWPIVSIEAGSFDDMTAIRELAFGHMRWMEVNELAEGMGGPSGGGIFAPPSRLVDTRPSPPCMGIPWGLDRIQRQDVPEELSGEGVRVYVLDTGVTPNSEFGTRLLDGVNCMSGACTPGDTRDDTGHGTHVAGVIAGSCYGVAGGAEIVPVKVLGSSAGGYDAVISGLKYSVYDLQRAANGDTGGRTDGSATNVRGIINMSLGGPRSAALNDAVKRAVALGVPVIASAGNDGFSNACTLSPSSSAAAVCVSATNAMDTAASFSNVGSCVDIWAPGRDVVSADYRNEQGYVIKSGTSQATAYVAGAAALLMQAAPHLKPWEAVGVIYNAAELLDLAPDTTRRFLSLHGLLAALDGLTGGGSGGDPAFG